MTATDVPARKKHNVFILFLIHSFSTLTYVTSYCLDSASLFADASAAASICSPFVDYDTYFPSSSTSLSQSVHEAANAYFNNTNLMLLSSKCQVEIKRAVCGTIYTKCSTHGYPTSPCRSTCEVVSTACQGANLIWLSASDATGNKQQLLNCSVASTADGSASSASPSYTSSYSGLFLGFGDDGNSSSCNPMNATVSADAVARMAPREVVDFYGLDNDGACSGIVSSVYESPYPVISTYGAMPVIAAEGTGENATSIEAALRANYDNLPPWMSASCYEAYRKFHCTSTMLSSERVSFYDVLVANKVNVTWLAAAWSYYYREASLNISALLAHEIVLPRLPAREVCNAYVTQCGAYLQRVGEAIPACTGTTYLSVSSGSRVDMYPPQGSPHALMNITVNVHPGSSLTLALFSTPSLGAENSTGATTGGGTTTQLSAANGTYGTASFTTVCPHGFVIPDEPENPRNSWITGTGCAVRCVSNAWTDDEYSQLENALRTPPKIGFPLIVILIIGLLTDKLRRTKQPLVILYCLTASLQTFFFLILEPPLNLGKDFSDTNFCINNAVRRTQDDGPSVCVAQAFGLQFFLVSNILSWFSLTVDLFLKLVMERHTREYDFYVYLVITFLIPVICCIYAGANGYYGFSGLNPYCIFNSGVTIHQTWADMHLYVLVFTGIGFLLMVPVILKIVLSSKTVIKTHTHAARNSHDQHGGFGAYYTGGGGSSAHPSEDHSSVSAQGGGEQGNSTTPHGGGEDQHSHDASGAAGASSNKSDHSELSLRIDIAVQVVTAKLKLVKTSVSFVAAMLIVIACLLYYRGYQYVNDDLTATKYALWVACIFSTYNRRWQDPATSWVSVCAAVPPERLPFEPTIMATACLSGLSLFIVFVYLPFLITTCGRILMPILLPASYAIHKLRSWKTPSSDKSGGGGGGGGELNKHVDTHVHHKHHQKDGDDDHGHGPHDNNHNHNDDDDGVFHHVDHRRSDALVAVIGNISGKSDDGYYSNPPAPLVIPSSVKKGVAEDIVVVAAGGRRFSSSTDPAPSSSVTKNSGNRSNNNEPHKRLLPTADVARGGEGGAASAVVLHPPTTVRQPSGSSSSSSTSTSRHHNTPSKSTAAAAPAILSSPVPGDADSYHNNPLRGGGSVLVAHIIANVPEHDDHENGGGAAALGASLPSGTMLRDFRDDELINHELEEEQAGAAASGRSQGYVLGDIDDHPAEEHRAAGSGVEGGWCVPGDKSAPKEGERPVGSRGLLPAGFALTNPAAAAAAAGIPSSPSFLFNKIRSFDNGGGGYSPVGPRLS